jgi:hypothetical protein
MRQRQNKAKTRQDKTKTKQGKDKIRQDKASNAGQDKTISLSHLLRVLGLQEFGRDWKKIQVTSLVSKSLSKNG